MLPLTEYTITKEISCYLIMIREIYIFSPTNNNVFAENLFLWKKRKLTCFTKMKICMHKKIIQRKKKLYFSFLNSIYMDKKIIYYMPKSIIFNPRYHIKVTPHPVWFHALYIQSEKIYYQLNQSIYFELLNMYAKF